MISFITRLHTLKDLTLDLLFPPVCIACGNTIRSQKELLCKNCFDHLSLNTSLYCPICGARKTSLARCHRAAPYLLAPACAYADPLPALIHHFKYGKMLGVRTILSALVITHLKITRIDLEKFACAYVPLHPLNELRRGFNQSFLIAQDISSYFSIPLGHYLLRARHTKQQAKHTTYEQRHANVAGAFALNPECGMVPESILLIDDVSTSGATLQEASEALLARGAKRIIAAVVAKA